MFAHLPCQAIIGRSLCPQPLLCGIFHYITTVLAAKLKCKLVLTMTHHLWCMCAALLILCSNLPCDIFTGRNITVCHTADILCLISWAASESLLFSQSPKVATNKEKKRSLFLLSLHSLHEFPSRCFLSSLSFENCDW